MGSVIIVVVLLIVLPVSVFISGGFAAGIIAHFVRTDVEASHEGSELLELNS